MLKLKTITQFYVPVRRGTLHTVVRMIIHSATFETNNIIVKGEYYYKDEDGNDCPIIDGSINLTKPKDQLQPLQELFPTLISNTDIFENVDQRVRDFAYAILQAENGLNYGTNVTDWVEDSD